MSQTDSFIEEVNEEVRRDRLFKLMRRYGWIAILLIIVIVGTAAWREYEASVTTSRNQAFGDAVLDALGKQKNADRVSALQAIHTDGNGQAALVNFLVAGALDEEGGDAAGKAGDTLAKIKPADDLPSIYLALAHFKSLLVEAGTLAPADRRAALQPLAQPGQPFHLLAEEQIALSYVEEDNSAKALEELKKIVDDAETPADLKQRASGLIVALGGTPDQAG